ncbi:hypothetical protein D3C80_1596450 [compost metagenome]
MLAVGDVGPAYLLVADRDGAHQLVEHAAGGDLAAQVVGVGGLVEAGGLQAPLEGRRAGEAGRHRRAGAGHLGIVYGDGPALGLLPEQFLVDQLLQRLALEALVHRGVANLRDAAALLVQVVLEVPFETEQADLHVIDPRGAAVLLRRQVPSAQQDQQQSRQGLHYSPVHGESTFR